MGFFGYDEVTGCAWRSDAGDLPRPRGRRTASYDFVPNFDENSKSTVDGHCARGDCDGCDDCDFVDMARLSVFLHVADPGQQALGFRVGARQDALYDPPGSILKRGSPADDFFLPQANVEKIERVTRFHILILHPPIHHFSLALRLRWSFPFDFMHSTSLCLYPLRLCTV
jgi:hypothetical protein